ncbi:hypothetical protein Hanom_Chr03g00266591 [Helianthus anomalus]
MKVAVDDDSPILGRTYILFEKKIKFIKIKRVKGVSCLWYTNIDVTMRIVKL